MLSNGDFVSASVRRAGIANHHLIAYSLSNISVKNYPNWLMCVEVIVCYISVVFETQCGTTACRNDKSVFTA